MCAIGYKRELTRKSNTTDNGILALIEHVNEEVNQENSNKNPVINSTQRDIWQGRSAGSDQASFASGRYRTGA